MKKILFILLGLLFLVQASPAKADTELELNCTSAILLDAATGNVLYEKNSDAQCYPASVTKLMTMTLILEAVENGTIALTDMVSVSKEAASMGGSQVYLYEGEQRTVEEMLIAIAVGSGNDAAYAMAEFVGGTYADFIDMMNAKASELGMTGTHFVNPHGLHDEQHYTTAQDLGKLAQYALENTNILDYTSIYEYEFRPEPNLLTLWNTNRLLKWYDGADGLKTGYTTEAGRNLVATAERDGLRLISVVLGCPDRNQHFQDSMTLLDYGFNNYSYNLIYEQGTYLASIPVEKGKIEKASLAPVRDVGYIAAKNQQPEIRQEITLEERIYAPAEAGTVCGTLTIYINEQAVDTVDLVLAENVDRCSWGRSWCKLIQTMW